MTKIEGVDFECHTSMDDSVLSPLRFQAEPRQERPSVSKLQTDAAENEPYQWTDERLG